MIKKKKGNGHPIKKELENVSKALRVMIAKIEKIQKQVGGIDALTAKSKAVAAAKKRPMKAVARKKGAPQKKGPAKSATVLNSVFDVIKKSKDGASIAKLKEKTILDSRQLSNALYKLSKRGKIKAKSRGVYIKK